MLILVLLIIAALCAVFALLGTPSRIDLTAVGLLLTVIVLLLDSHI